MCIYFTQTRTRMEHKLQTSGSHSERRKRTSEFHLRCLCSSGERGKGDRNTRDIFLGRRSGTNPPWLVDSQEGANGFEGGTASCHTAGSNRQAVIFQEDPCSYLNRLIPWAGSYHLRVLGYCLTTNRIHVLAVSKHGYCPAKVFETGCRRIPRGRRTYSGDGAGTCGRSASGRRNLPAARDDHQFLRSRKCTWRSFLVARRSTWVLASGDGRDPFRGG
jgi:hypothetical protein